QPPADLALRPALPAQEITDKLPGLVAGQKLLAEIQSLMPNGTYRALINQRSVTLALPFAAKSGDALELEVAESNGKLTLAVVARAGTEGGKGGELTTASLSRTGQLISNLLAGSRDGKGSSVALPLNGNQPLAANPPRSGQDLVPLLKQAIIQSGMFYEAHQAEWVEGRYSKAQLLQEPQGKLPPATPPAQQAAPPGTEPANVARTAAAESSVPAQTITAEAANKATAQPAQPAQPGQLIAPQVQTLVQHQLEAFASQNFSWQGQLWPGQQIHWQIESEADGREQGGDNPSEKWQTRLRLTLPRLGEVDARLRIEGQQITLTMIADNAETRTLLSGDAATLRSQLEEAGLNLASLGIVAPRENKDDGTSSG
uniref:flagellar hook-length control protein FliK n=1 Tax=Accumulibacter sp. TaxID=2053492 RepID=UPI0028C493EB